MEGMVSKGYKENAEIVGDETQQLRGLLESCKEAKQMVGGTRR